MALSGIRGVDGKPLPASTSSADVYRALAYRTISNKWVQPSQSHSSRQDSEQDSDSTIVKTTHKI